MKRFIIKVFLFLLPLALILVVTEMFVRSIPNSYKYKYEFMETNASGLRTIILGSSHAYRGLNPAFMPEPAFNLAYSSQDIKRDFFLLEHFIGDMDSLKYVIMSISYHSLPEMMENLGQSRVLLKYYAIYMEYTDAGYSLELTIPGWIEKVMMTLSGKDVCNCDSLGFAKDVNGKPITDKEALSTLAYHTYRSMENVEENISILEKMADMLEDKNVKLFFVTTPLTQEYYRNMNDEQYELMVSTVSSIAEKYPNVYYLNYADDKRFSYNDFKDVDHLNGKGAEIFSKIVTDTIQFLNSVH